MKGLGTRIKNLRLSRKMTLVEVAQKTGIDQATLSRIENEKMTGTLSSHMKIAEVLGTRLPDLYEHSFSQIDEAKEKAARQKLETFSHSSGALAELLTTNILQKKMMPILLKIRPKGRTETEEYAPQSERFIYVISGEVDVSLGKDRKKLRAGETLYFNAALPHQFKNPGRIECICLSVMTPTSL